MEKQWQHGAPSPAHPCGVCYATCGPVITVEAHVPFAGAHQHTNNTAELSGIVEPLRFLSSTGLVPLGSQACHCGECARFVTVCARFWRHTCRSITTRSPLPRSHHTKMYQDRPDSTLARNFKFQLPMPLVLPAKKSHNYAPKW